jgi:YD repeat-containing protein
VGDSIAWLDSAFGTPGPWLAHYTYDALGRLIRKQTPVRNASTGTQTGIRTERYYYDGARRIQEVVAAPIELIEPFTGGGSGGGSGGDPLDGGTNIGEEMLAQGGEPTQPGGSPGGGGGVGGSRSRTSGSIASTSTSPQTRAAM